MGIENLILRLVGIHIHTGEPDEKCRGSIAKLLSKAKSSIKVVAGELNSEFYGAPLLLETLEKALKKGVAVELVVGRDADTKSLETLASHQGPISISMLSFWPTLHFIVVDNKHVRLEEPHRPQQRKRVDYIVSNYIYAKKWSREFDELRQKANPWRLSNAEV